MSLPRTSGPLLACAAVAVLLAAQFAPQSDRAVWRQSSFHDFASGSFGDGGANTYVSARGRVQSVNRWDLNLDGYIDLVFANSHPHAEKLDAAIYWGNGDDYSDSRRSFIPTNGAQWLIPVDVNRDGRPDLLVPNYHNGTYDRMDSYIYLNGGRDASAPGQWGFPPFTRRISLPSQAAQYAAAADLNRDGYVDVVLAYSGGYWEYRNDPWRPYQDPSRIYWGGPDGFSKDRFTALPTPAASSVAIADLDADGWPDIVVASYESPSTKDVDSHVYWGGPDGFSETRRTSLPTRGATMVRIADLNRDGKPDVVFANSEGERSYVYWGGGRSLSPRRRLELETLEARDVEIADVNRDGYPDVFFANASDHGNPLAYSYLYLGSAEGFRRRVSFETVGAYGAAIADLNGDGLPDIVTTSFRDYDWYDVPSYIYWNSPSGFDRLRRTPLYTHGAVGVSIADLNGDHHPDIVIANTTSGYRGNFHPAFIYWGDAKGRYSPEHRTSLPAVDAYEIGAADLNDDGYPDLVLANDGENSRISQESYIYWGGPKGFSPDRRSGIEGERAMGITIADLDRDGWLDIVVGNSEAIGDRDVGSFIYWGSPDGYSPLRRTAVPTDGAEICAVADLNRDGRLDIIFEGPRADRGTVIYWGDGTRNYSIARRTFIPGSAGTNNPELADLNKDGYLDLILPRGGPLGTPSGMSSIFWGNASGEFSPARETKLPTEGAGTQPTVADLNGDGWLDIVFPNYSTGTSRSGMSRIFWGGPRGYSEKRMQLLPTDGGTGSLAADFNHDGFMDLLFVCHRREGNPDRLGAFNEHKANSFLYWGGPHGFRADNRLEIPTEGPHNDYGVDLGNIYDRRFRFDYISAPHRESNGLPARLEWKGETPFGSKLTFQLRSGPSKEKLEVAPWREVAQGAIHGFQGPWYQYRVVFLSPDGVNYPVLTEVSLHFR